MTLFRLDASILPEESASAEIAHIVEAEWQAAHPGDLVVRRHVGIEPVPAEQWRAAVTGAETRPAARTLGQWEALRRGRALADELATAHAALFAVPMYNFGVSQHFKSWADLVIAAAGADAALLRGKPVVLVTVRGGSYGPGTPHEGWDHSTPYLVRILADVWGADLCVVERELTMAATSPGMKRLRPEAERLHADALRTAHRAGRLLAASPATADRQG